MAALRRPDDGGAGVAHAVLAELEERLLSVAQFYSRLENIRKGEKLLFANRWQVW
jgi:hypothetical protein